MQTWPRVGWRFGKEKLRQLLTFAEEKECLGCAKAAYLQPFPAPTDSFLNRKINKGGAGAEHVLLHLRQKDKRVVQQDGQDVRSEAHAGVQLRLGRRALRSLCSAIPSRGGAP